jgi:hypothetical protein
MNTGTVLAIGYARAGRLPLPRLQGRLLVFCRRLRSWHTVRAGERLSLPCRSRERTDVDAFRLVDGLGDLGRHHPRVFIALCVIVGRIIRGVRNPDEPVDPDRTEML